VELWNAIASSATFLVLAITAIVAVIHLQHIQGSNQVTALDEFRDALESPQYRAGVLLGVDMAKRMDEASSRRELEGDPLPEWAQPMLYLFRLFETLGTYVKYGILNERVVFDLWSTIFINNWERLVPAIIVMRRSRGDSFMENFEMLVCLAKRQQEKLKSSYPKHLPRIAPEDRWLSVDHPS
jgi:hypothetical protein